MKFCILIIILQMMNWPTYLTQEFDKEYFGVGFSPFTKNWDESNTQILPKTLSYSSKEIKIMLEKISSQFTNIFTYNMGVTSKNFNNDWKDIKGNALIGRTAGEFNKEKTELKISLLQGINLTQNKLIQEAEIQNAFNSLNYSNALFNQTTSGLIFINDSNQIKPELLKNGPQRATYFGVVNLIERHKAKARSFGVGIGARVHDCGQIFSGPNSNDLIKLAKSADFILCVMQLDFNIASRGPVIGVQHVSDSYKEIQKRYLKENPNLEIMIGDFGWPSEGNSYNRAPSSSENLQLFWKEMDKWAKMNKIKVFLFEAFDEPWRSDHNSREDVPDGKLGALGHYGWWKRAKNNSDLYFDKIIKSSIVESNDNLWKLIVGIVVPIVILFLIVIIYLNWRLKFFKKFVNKLSSNDIEEFYNGISNKLESKENEYEFPTYLPYDKKYEIPKDKMIIDKNKILGSGAFGTVYQGRILGMDDSFAFKTLKTTSSVEGLKSLLAEIKIMSYIGRHKYIVSFIGAYTADISEGVIYLAVELCANGNLEGYLRGNNSNGVKNEYVNMSEDTNKDDKTTTEEMLIWSTQIANGMAYLENKKVIHADLATRNILLTKEMDIKITDFGLSRRLYEYTSYVKKKQEPLPWRWMAIETLKTMNFSHASDVWAFGITMWEIFSHGRLPYPGLAWNLFFVDKLEEGLTLLCPKSASQEIYEIMQSCWKLNPCSRPNFSQLLNSLQNAKK